MQRFLLLGLLIFLSSYSYAQFPADIYLEEFATGITLPTEIANAGDDRLFVCEKAGIIKIIGADGQVLPEPFLDISSKVASDQEQGLLSMAFHPDFANNGRVYINYTDKDFYNNVVRFDVDPSNPNKADLSSEKLILKIEDCEFTLHHGGCLRFGPEGYLYIAVGDCGFIDKVQELDSFLGKLLRIDVDNGDPYSIPADNPLYSTTFHEEIWALGLRNPWKFSFNQDNGDLWISDVGYRTFEEINVAAAGSSLLQNYGWPCYEGTEEGVFAFDCDNLDIEEVTFPLGGYAYDSCLSCGGSITGGYVYEGSSELMENTEAYIYGDYCTGKMYSTYLDNGQYETVEIYDNDLELDNISTFGENNEGDLFVADIVKGTIYKIQLDCRLPDMDIKVASCKLAEDGCVEITIPNNQGILSTTLKDQNGLVIPESGYCNLKPGVYVLETVNSDSNCSIETSFEIDVFEPRIDRTRASCSIIDDGILEICISQSVSDAFGYYIESEEGVLIDPSSYTSILPGYYNMIIDNSTAACMDTFNFYIDFDQDYFPVSFTDGILMVEDNYDSYQWYFTDTLAFRKDYMIIENATEPTYTPTEIGYYYIKATDLDGCEHYRTRSVDSIVSSVDLVNLNNQITLSPNPVSDKLIISFKNVKSQNLNLTVYDINGQKIHDENISNTSQITEYVYLTGALKAGTYMISLSSDSFYETSVFVKE